MYENRINLPKQKTINIKDENNDYTNNTPIAMRLEGKKIIKNVTFYAKHA